ncbi:hypothetical protein HID58_053445, partial [Brassica napus]
YSRSEKEKWAEAPCSPRKRSPIKIPDSNNEALIAENKLTLIGRMKSEIQLPSGEVIEVEFEYMKMEKHCFTCFSLSHEEEECPTRNPNDPPARNRRLRITQLLALERIEAEKRQHDDRRGYKPPEPRNREEATARNQVFHFSASRDSRDTNRRNTNEYNKKTATSRSSAGGGGGGGGGGVELITTNHNPRYRAIALPQGEHRANFPNLPTGSSGKRPLRSPEEHYQSPEPTRDITTHAAPVGTVSGSLRSQERRSALDRLADPDLRDHLPRRRMPSASSGRLQDVEIMYDGDVNRGTPLGASLLNAISPTVEDTEHNSARAPATQRLGGLATLGSRERTKTALAAIEPPPTTVEPTVSKAIAKRRVPATRKRVARSPLQALKKKKVIVPKALPQRKRICTEKGTSMPYNITLEILESSPNIIDAKVADLVASAWNQSPVASVISKLNLCRQRIIQWSKERNQKANQLIASTQQELDAA